MNHAFTLFFADALADDRGVVEAPASMLVQWADAWPRVTLLAVGSPAAVASHPAADSARRVNLGHRLLIPALVNAHTHLDLTSVGPQPFDETAGFTGWIDAVRASRPATDDLIAESVKLGIEKSLVGGVVAVGDIAGDWSPTPLQTLRDSPLSGVSFLECFGLGAHAHGAIARFKAITASVPLHKNNVTLGFQPHAPYSAGASLYQHATDLCNKLQIPLSTHLAESLAERQCVTNRQGPIREFLESLGLWNDEVAQEFGKAPTPVQHIATPLASAPWLVAHVNDCSDADLDLLAQTRTTVVYCPRASAYFGHNRDFGAHRYQDMLDRGVRVVLGTDSILCLPQAEANRLSVFDEMRLLRRRDRTDPVALLTMATSAAADVLGLGADHYRLNPGPTAGVASIELPADCSGDPLERSLLGASIPTLLSNESV